MARVFDSKFYLFACYSPIERSEEGKVFHVLTESNQEPKRWGKFALAKGVCLSDGQ